MARGCRRLLSMAAVAVSTLLCPGPPKIAYADATPPQGAGGAEAAEPCRRGKDVDGAQFLAAAQQLGIPIKSTCLVNDLAANKFYAPPGASCTITFSSDSWLSKGWEFAAIKGVGSFESTVDSGSLTVTIGAKGGFSATQLVVKSNQHACAAKLAEILR
jgi:hypothetical protein